MSWQQNSFVRQFRIWRNHRKYPVLRETFGALLRRVLWTVVYQLHACRLGFKALRRVTCGSYVRYRGERWQLGSMVSLATWSAYGPRGEREEYLDLNEAVPEISLRELWHRFKACRDWWVAYWLDIAVGKRIWPGVYAANSEEAAAVAADPRA